METFFLSLIVFSILLIIFGHRGSK